MAFINKELLTINDEKGKLSLFSLALPLFFGSISNNLIALVQTVMCTRYAGGYFVLPTSLSSMPVVLMQNLIMLVTTGTSILLSVLIGRKEEENCRKLIGTAIFSIIGLSIIVCSLCFIFAEPIMNIIALQNPEYAIYADEAILYFRYRTIASMVVMVRELYTAVLRCYGKTKIGLYSALTANLTNAGFTALCMFALPIPSTYAIHFLGIIGIIAPTAGFLVVGIAYKKYKIKADLHFSFKTLGTIVKIGMPASVSSVSYALSSTITTMICLTLPTASYLAKTYISQVVIFSNMFGYAIGQASSIMIGRCCGMKDYDRADKIHNQNAKIILLSNGALSLMFALLSNFIATIFFNASPEVNSIMVVVMWIDIIVELGRGLNHIGQFGLNATGDVLFTTVVSMAGCWAVSVGLAFVFVSVFGWGIYGIWIAFALDELVRGTAYLIRWKTGRWRNHL